MWMTTHIATGAVIYDSTWGEKKWLRWLLIVLGGFVSHWLLDSTAVYHYFTWDNWWDYAFVGWQAIGLIWLLLWCSWRQILAGFIAWLSWDIEWLFRYFGWVGQEGFIHKYLLATSSPGYHITEPVAATLEGLLLLALIWLARPNKWKKKKDVS
jgi:hypothetical protein